MTDADYGRAARIKALEAMLRACVGAFGDCLRWLDGDYMSSDDLEKARTTLTRAQEMLKLAAITPVGLGFEIVKLAGIQPNVFSQHIFEQFGDAAFALLAKPVATRDAVEKWAVKAWAEIEDHGWHGFADGVLLALSRFAPPASNAPILRMSEAEIGIAMRAEVDEDPRNWSIGDCARVAHRLAQPVPEVDPDAGAKKLAWDHHCIGTSEAYRRSAPDNLWSVLIESVRDFWRERAAAEKGNG